MIAAPPELRSIAPRAPVADPAGNWKQQWREALRTPAELLAVLGLGESATLGIDPQSPFPARVPRAFAARMRPGDPADPLLLQVLPQLAERLEVPGYGADPVGDRPARKAPGLLHKYSGRALLVLTGSCAVHCRYCFRRHYPYAEETLTAAALDQAFHYLQAHPEIDELLLSGGDPLSLDTPKLQALTTRLAELPQLRRLRIHSRLPVVLPARVDAALLDWLQALPWPTTVVLHVNHAAELDEATAQALTRLRRTCSALLNQAVLLRGVNASVEALAHLSERLFDCGVLPYYLNLLDPVAGAAHFDVAEAEARALVEALRRRLPGYLVPRLVREVAGAPYKVPMGG